MESIFAIGEKRLIVAAKNRYSLGRNLLMGTTADGSIWGEHESCDRLLVMGLASGLMDFVIADRTVWAAFPGHMPYVLTTPELYA